MASAYYRFDQVSLNVKLELLNRIGRHRLFLIAVAEGPSLGLFDAANRADDIPSPTLTPSFGSGSARSRFWSTGKP